MDVQKQADRKYQCADPFAAWYALVTGRKKPRKQIARGEDGKDNSPAWQKAESFSF